MEPKRERRVSTIVRSVTMALVAALATGCSGEAPPTPAGSEPAMSRHLVAPSASAADVAPLFAKYECNRCHSGPMLEPAAPDKDCVGCHQRVVGGELKPAPAKQQEWRQRAQSLPATPSLGGLERRLRRAWIERFLLEPSDIRPALAASMPRLPITPADAAAMAAALVPSEAPPARFDPAQVARGRELYAARGCPGCHAFSGLAEALAVPSPPSPDGELPRTMAPDLRHTRDRFQSGRLVEWLRFPQRLAPTTAMPTLGLSEAEARALAAFITLAPLTEPPAPALAPRLPLLDRHVGYDEVAERVFRKICWHCHATADYARGDGGPGNTGGFGFPARGLDLSSYVGTQSGALSGAGTGDRYSVFAPGDDGVPRLVTVLLARHAEEAGGRVEGVRGMPLGFPALPYEDIQLVETWIALGRPEP